MTCSLRGVRVRAPLTRLLFRDLLGVASNRLRSAGREHRNKGDLPDHAG
jgi:hypothetical protein